jgi:transforming growth factor-beta-induced protein
LALPPGALTTLLKAENVGLLTQTLTYHVVSGAVLSTDLTDGLEVASLNGATLAIGVDNTTATVTVNNATVSPADVLADNGVIHVIGQVLLPPDLVLPPSVVEIATSGNFSTLGAALQASGVDADISGPGPFTVFAPTEEAFANLPIGALEFLLRNTDILAAVLSYHVVNGAFLSTDLQDQALLPTMLPGASLMVSINGTVMINDATVSVDDVAALNGVVHIIDTVLIPEGKLPPNIPGLVVAAGEYPTLLAALTAGELVDPLSAPGPFTIFAPSEPAFAKLPTGTIESLLLPKNKDLLVKILQQHTISGLLKSTDISDGLTATALNGETLTFSATDAGITVDGVSVVSPNILALNGVVHVVNEVIIPDDVMLPMSTILEIAIADGRFTSLVEAVGATGLSLNETLSSPGPFSKYFC